MPLVRAVPDRRLAAIAHRATIAGNTRLIIDRAVVHQLGVEVRLIAANPKALRIKDPRSELEPGVALRGNKPVFEAKLEVLHHKGGKNEKRLLRRLLHLLAAD